ncbi:Uncharacterised protein [Mycobacteroides abscessus subsp. abscessus]|nr:Uncharacterised protein [Mycobacteroides abscessus subsp. abscessus]
MISPPHSMVRRPESLTSPSTEYSTSHLSMICSKRPRFCGVTTAIIRSWDSDMRISPGVRVGSRSSTLVRSTCIPPSPLEASSDVAQEIPAAPRSWMPSTTDSLNSSRQHSMSTFSAKGSPTCTAGRLEGLASSKDSEASTEAPPMPSPPVRAPNRITRLPTPEALARRMSSWRITPTARALTRGLSW